ncbi:MAG: helix-hairpin-helix domain-containing protein, partial [Candidatus Thorarchaeota archaeon]|nr:helix-hairpin-helix domain-containing protein [Candidatus Thorarchaeota archaeon]
MSIENISDIPGVGDKVRQALIEHFGSDPVALKVILDSRVDLVAAVPGIGARQAVNIVKAAYEIQFGASSNMILRSTDVRKIFEQVLDIIRGYANTGYAKDKLFLYFPLPPERLDEIQKRQIYFADAMAMSSKLSEEQRTTLQTNLSQIRGLYRKIKPRRIEGRVIITNDEKVFDTLIREGADRWCPVYVLSEGENAKDYAQGYDLVFYISPFGSYDDSVDMLDNVEILGKDWSIADVLPEQTIGFYSRNYRVVDAACKLTDEFGKIPTNESVRTFAKDLDSEQLTKVKEILENLNEDGDITEGVAPELDRYRKAVKSFPTAIAEMEAWLNDEITKRIVKSQITLGGQQIISILQSADLDGSESGAMRNMLPAEIIETFTDTIQNAEDKLVQDLGLSAREADWATGVISEEIALPVKLMPMQVNDLEDKLRRKFADKQFKNIKKFAGNLEKLRDSVTKAVQTLLEFDLFLAVGLFSTDYNLRTPDISPDYSGIGVEKATNIFLVESMLKGRHGQVEPIDY